MVSVMHEYLMEAVYFAPRGKKRLLNLGTNIAQRYLSPEDTIIGVLGEAGAGKSLLIRGMFPGMELTNDDNGINLRPLPLMADAATNNFRNHTYHLDVRMESAFTPIWELAEAIKMAVKQQHRVVVEHFEIVYPYLEYNAEILIGIGEEVIVTRPGLFGPKPQELADKVIKSLIYRKMAHSAEDITGVILEEMGIKKPEYHSDIRHGFILEFAEKPDIDLDLVEERIMDDIAKNKPICFHDEEHIMVGNEILQCTGPRIHMKRTGDIKGFKLLKEFKWDPYLQLYLMVGLVGQQDGC